MAVNSFNAQNPPVNTKGDVFTFSTIPTRLGVGANNTVLTADSSTATGLKWGTVSAGGYTSIATGTLSGASTTISSIPGTYTDLYLILVNAYPSTNGRTISLQINGDNTASRHTEFNYGAVSGTGTFDSNRWNSIVPDQSNSVYQGITALRIYNYANTTTWKMGEWVTINNYSVTTTRPNKATGLGAYNQTDAITSLKFFDTDGGNLGGGTYTLYGVK
jgi:hypothetical protein